MSIPTVRNSAMSRTLQSSVFILVLASSKPIHEIFKFRAEHEYLVDLSFHPSCGEITSPFSDNTGPHSSIEFVLGYRHIHLVRDISLGYHGSVSYGNLSRRAPNSPYEDDFPSEYGVDRTQHRPSWIGNSRQSTKYGMLIAAVLTIHLCD